MSIRATVSLTVLLFGLSCAAGWLMQPGHSPATGSAENGGAARMNAGDSRSGEAHARPGDAWRKRLERDLAGTPLSGGIKCNGAEYRRLCEAGPEPGWRQRIRDYAAEWIQTSPSSARAWVNALSTSKEGRFSADLVTLQTSAIFEAWAKVDPGAALAAAQEVPDPSAKGQALLSTAMQLAGSNPERARRILTEHLDLFKKNRDLCVPEMGGSAGQPMRQLISGLPAGEARGQLLNACLLANRGEISGDAAELWKSLSPAGKKDALHASNVEPEGSFVFSYLSKFRDAESLRRELAESGTPEDVTAFFAYHASEWAQQDLAAAVEWTLQHQKGSRSINEVTGMFSSAAATNFEQARQLWLTLPDGSQKAQILRAMRSGVPLYDADALKQLDVMVQSLPPGLREVADSPY